jgi:hypothetical protein
MLSSGVHRVAPVYAVAGCHELSFCDKKDVFYAKVSRVKSMNGVVLIDIFARYRYKYCRKTRKSNSRQIDFQPTHCSKGTLSSMLDQLPMHINNLINRIKTAG